MLTVILSIINFVSGAAFQGIANAVTGVIGKISSDQAVEFAVAASAEQSVLVAARRRTARPTKPACRSTAACSGCSSRCWRPTLVRCGIRCWSISIAAVPVVVHVGALVRAGAARRRLWRVGALPGNYGTEEWQTIASLLGIQTAAVGGFMYYLHK